VNVIKEMMENSLDAGSKHIHISVTKGGFDMIKVKDDGHGIQVRLNWMIGFKMTFDR
jgi:DNA mismatch repair protein MutL